MRPSPWVAVSWMSEDNTRIKPTYLDSSPQLPSRLQQGFCCLGVSNRLCLCQSALVPGTGSWHIHFTPWDAASFFLTSCIPFQNWNLSQFSPVVSTWLASDLFSEMKLGSTVCSYSLNGGLTVQAFLLWLKSSKCPWYHFSFSLVWEQ